MSRKAPPTTPYPPELELLFACARWPQRPEDSELIRQLTTTPLDWPHFLRLAVHHRLAPLVAHNIQAANNIAPPLPLQPAALEALEQLRHLAQANTYEALRNLAEMRRVVQKFRSEGICVRVLKGLPLAQTVFGNISLRAAGDIDLMIDEASLLEADRILRGFRYRGLFRVELFSPRRLAFYRSHWKDVAYSCSATGFEVDLHWRCFRNREMPGSDLCSRSASAMVSFGSFQVDTPPPMETLLYLCVHGTLDGWLYLKSLVDVGAQVRTSTSAELNALADLAAGHGVLPELTAALILVRRYLAMDHWSTKLLTETDSTVAHILRFADRALVEGKFLTDREDIRTSSMMAYEMGLRHNFRYRVELLLRVLFRARMWEAIPLPDFLFGIYPLLSPVEWIFFRVRQWTSKSSSDDPLSTLAK